MSDWIDVCGRDEMLPGEFKVVWDEDTPIAVYNIDGIFYAITGDVTRAPATVPIASFPIREDDGHIFTRDDRFD